MSKEKGKIFISYRREGGLFIARTIHGELEKRGYNAFLDLERLGAGKFNEALLKEIETSTNFIIILSNGSLDRCVNKDDWVRKELAYAMKKGINIVPVMEQNFKFPEKLPEDIKDIPNINAVVLDGGTYFDACVNKLETFFADEMPQEEKVVSDETRKNKSVTKRKTTSVAKPKVKLERKWVIAAATIMLVCAIGVGGWLFFSNRNSVVADTSTIESYGNISGNLCNEGFASYAGSSSAGLKNLVYLNRLEDDWIYWYNTSTDKIRKKVLGGESEELLEQKDVGYLLVTPDWFYYTVGEGTSTLYRAPRLEEGSEIGEAQTLLTGIMQENKLIVEENIVYFCKEGKGIFCYDIQKEKETLLLAKENTWEFKLSGKNGEWIYAQGEDSVWRVNVNSGSVEELISNKSQLTSYQFTSANVYGSWIYMVVTDAADDMINQVDSIYRMRLDGSRMSRVFTAESVNHRISAVNLYEGEKLYIIVEAGEEEVYAYFVDSEKGKVTEFYPEDFSGILADVVLDEGNTTGNLCNRGFVTRVEEVNTTYRGSGSMEYYNKYCEKYGFYYNSAQRGIFLQVREDEAIQSEVLIENVDCSYLYATPEWLYYVLKEDDTANLYRAENKCEEHTLGNSERLASDIFEENSVAIYKGCIYYWAEEGLFRARMDGQDANLIFAMQDGKTGHGWKTYHITDEYLAFYVADKLWKINIADGSIKCAMNGEKYFTDGIITSAIADCDRTFFAVSYLDETKPDEIWCVTEGSAPERIIVTSLEDGVITDLNIVAGMCYVRFSQESGIDTAYFYINMSNPELEF